jgi:hypothetical protein
MIGKARESIFEYGNNTPAGTKITCELTISYRLPQIRPVIYTGEWTIRD